MTVTLERAEELILKKREDDANKIIKIFPENEEVQLLNGRWGAYLKIGKDNFKLPKDIVPEELTLEECLKIAESSPSPKKKTTAKAESKPKATKTAGKTGTKKTVKKK